MKGELGEDGYPKARCPECDTYFPTRDDYRKHLKDEHPEVWESRTLGRRLEEKRREEREARSEDDSGSQSGSSSGGGSTPMPPPPPPPPPC